MRLANTAGDTWEDSVFPGHQDNTDGLIMQYQGSEQVQSLPVYCLLCTAVD